MNVEIWIDPIDEIAHVWLDDGRSFRLNRLQLRRLRKRGVLKIHGMTLRLGDGR